MGRTASSVKNLAPLLATSAAILVLAYVYVISFSLGWRAIFVVHGGVLFLCGCALFIRDLPSFLLFLMVFVFPLQFGYHLVHTLPPKGTEIAEVWPFATGARIDVADFILAILYVLWAFRLAGERMQRGPLVLGNSLGALLLVWTLHVFVSSLLKATSFRHSLYEMSVLLKGFMLFFYLVNNITTLRELRIVVYALFANNVFHATFMIFQYVTGLNYDIHGELSSHWVEKEGFRPAGFTGSWDSAAAMIDWMLPVGLAYYLIAKNWAVRSGVAACNLLMLVGLLVTKVRASLAAVIILGTAVVVLGYLRGWVSRRRATGAFMVGVMLLIVATPIMYERFQTGDYGQDRWPLVYTAVNMFTGNWLLGVGANNYSFNIADYVPPDAARAWIYIVHNEFLLRLAETGLIGFSLFYFLSGLAMVKIWRATRSSEPWVFMVSTGLFAGFLGSLAHRMLTAYHFESMFYMFCIILALTFFMDQFEKKRLDESKQGDTSTEEPPAAAEEGDIEAAVRPIEPRTPARQTRA